MANNETGIWIAIGSAITAVGVVITGWLNGRNQRADQSEKNQDAARLTEDEIRNRFIQTLQNDRDKLEEENRSLRRDWNTERAAWDVERGKLLTQRNAAYDSRDDWFDQAKQDSHDWRNAMCALTVFYDAKGCKCNLTALIRDPPQIENRDDLPPCKKPKPDGVKNDHP